MIVVFVVEDMSSELDSAQLLVFVLQSSQLSLLQLVLERNVHESTT